MSNERQKPRKATKEAKDYVAKFKKGQSVPGLITYAGEIDPDAPEGTSWFDIQGHKAEVYEITGPDGQPGFLVLPAEEE